MKNKNLIIALVAVVLISFCATPGANASMIVGGSVLAISAAVFTIGIFIDKFTENADTEQKKAENVPHKPAAEPANTTTAVKTTG